VSVLVGVAEAAELAGVSPSTIYRWIQGGVFSLRYFPDGRQAIDRSQLDAIAESGENFALHRLFMEVGRTLSQAVALLPAVEAMFATAGWKNHAWSADKWEEIRVMAFKQAEAHGDIGPFLPRRGRPRKLRTHRLTGEPYLHRVTGEPVL
jgi:Helix-turn-helix domain